MSRILTCLLLLPVWLIAAGAAMAQEVNFLELSAGTPPPLNNMNVALSNAGAGGVPSGLTAGIVGFTAGGNLGDLSAVTNGYPGQVLFGLRIRGDLPYVVTTAQSFFTANNLQYRGVPTGEQNRGSFIRMTAGNPVGRGPTANPAGSQINAALIGDGLSLNSIAFGNVNISSTMIIQGVAPSILPDSGAPPPPAPPPPPPGPTTEPPPQQSFVEVPVFFSVPTWLALGPVNGGSVGTFSTNLQFAVFPRP